MNIMKTNMLSLNNKFLKEDAGNTPVETPIPSTTDPQKGMKALSFLGMQNLMANPKLAQEVGVINNNSDMSFKGGKFANAAKVSTMVLGTAMAAAALTSCDKDIKVSQSQTVIVDMQPVVDAIEQLRNDINENNKAETQRDKEVLEALNKALLAMYQLQTLVSNQTLTIDQFRELVLGKMENGELQRSAILDAIIVLQDKTEQAAIYAVTSIINAFENKQISFEQAMAEIQALLKDNNSLLSDIKEMLSKHFDKYDTDMAELKSLAYGIKKEQEATRKDVEKFAGVAVTMSKDIRNMTVDLADIRAKLKNGVKFDDSQLAALLKRINATQQMTKDEIVARLDAYIEGQNALADKLDTANNYLAKLGYVVSNDVINAINSIGDNLEGIPEIVSKLDELVAAVKSLTTSFNLYAKYTMDAHGKELDALNAIKADLSGIDKKISTLIVQGKTAEDQRKIIADYLEKLLKKADDIEGKLGRIPTVDEFDVMLEKNDADNRKFYGDLIKAAGVDPAQFENIKDLLKTINENLVDFQGTSNKYLADILDRIKAMDPSAPDYTDKLNKIIDLMENFKFECNCKCDCDNNHTINEGIIDIIG